MNDRELYEEGLLMDLSKAKARIEELEAKLAQQDDLVQAAVAAALREAATLCAHVSTADLKANNPTYEEGYSNGAGICHYEILALITEDAQAALDRVVAAEREECVGAVRAFFGNLYDEDEWTMEELVAAIRKGGRSDD